VCHVVRREPAELISADVRRHRAPARRRRSWTRELRPQEDEAAGLDAEPAARACWIMPVRLASQSWQTAATFRVVPFNSGNTGSATHSSFCGAPREVAYPTRLEVAFKNVQAVKIPTLMRGLSIAIAGHASAAAAFAEAGIASHTTPVFAIAGSGFQGYVIAGIAFGHEDEGASTLTPAPSCQATGTVPAGR
jgi:hypothetical protein